MNVIFIMLAVLVAQGAVSTTADHTVPYVTNVEVDANGSIRGTLVNPLYTSLTAWSLDAVDASGRARMSETTEALLSPRKFVSPQGTVEILVTKAAPSTTLVFVAGVTAEGMEIGDPKRAFKIIDMRLKRAQALETALDFLRALDPSTPGTEVYEDLRSLMGAANAVIVEDVRRRAGSGFPVAWLAAAEEVRQQNEAGARRHSVLRARLVGEQPRPGEEQ